MSKKKKKKKHMETIEAYCINGPLHCQTYPVQVASRFVEVSKGQRYAVMVVLQYVGNEDQPPH